jgi:large subunit ribosomal protein L23
MNFPGKPKRLGRFAGKRAAWKKAIVTLKEGQSIELFDQI